MIRIPVIGCISILASILVGAFKPKSLHCSFIISLLDGLKLTNHQKETLENIVIAVYGFINISYETITVNKYSVSSDPNSNSDRV